MSFWKEPFFHFALLGAAIFVWFSMSNPEPESADESGDDSVIVVDQVTIQTLATQFSAKMNRVPLPSEINAIIDGHIESEIMVREARALGLDKGDGIVRNRLVQKMRFLTTSAAQSSVPDDATLEAHLQENAARFEKGGQVAFRQFGLNEALNEEEIDSILEQLKEDKTPSRTTNLQLLPESLPLSGEARVDGLFGRGFFDRLSDLPDGEWAGPIQSGYGLHLVRVDETTPAQVPPLAEIRNEVLTDWRRTLSEQLTEAFMAAMMESYDITRPTEAEVSEWVSQ